MHLDVSLRQLRDIGTAHDCEGQCHKRDDPLFCTGDRHATGLCHGLCVGKAFGEHVCRGGDGAYGSGDFCRAAQVACGLVVAVLEQARGGLRTDNTCDLCRAVFLSLLDDESVLHFFPLLAAHAKARRERAVAEDGELDGGERQGGHHARLLEAFMMEDDIVNHFEGNNQKRQHKRHGKRCAGNLGIDAVSLDTLAFLFGKCCHG